MYTKSDFRGDYECDTVPVHVANNIFADLNKANSLWWSMLANRIWSEPVQADPSDECRYHLMKLKEIKR